MLIKNCSKNLYRALNLGYDVMTCGRRGARLALPEGTMEVQAKPGITKKDSRWQLS